jgi:hypothetical protein
MSCNTSHFHQVNDAELHPFSGVSCPLRMIARRASG